MSGTAATTVDKPDARESWRNTTLAGLANYIDSGSIVAGSAALALWAHAYNLSPTFLGLLGAFSANAISAGVGALIGGRLCDLFGRKKIYQYDMLFYAFGMAWLVFATQPWMIFVGVVIVGLAVGADIPASWSLIAEMAPAKARGKHSGLAQVFWYFGPVVVLLASLAMAPLGILGARIVFAHLLVVALALSALRMKMKESDVWEKAITAPDKRANVRDLFAGKNLSALLFLVGTYGFWNLTAGTQGFFFPYILRTVGDQSQAMSVGLQAVRFTIAVLAIIFVFMRFSDRVSHRKLFALSALLQVSGMAVLATFPLTIPTIAVYICLSSVGAGFGAQPFFQLWSSELFPTLLRSTAQGVIFAIVRIVLGVWSVAVPIFAATGFHTLAWVLLGFYAVSGAIGVAWTPTTRGKTLDQIEDERR